MSSTQIDQMERTISDNQCIVHLKFKVTLCLMNFKSNVRNPIGSHHFYFTTYSVQGEQVLSCFVVELYFSPSMFTNSDLFDRNITTAFPSLVAKRITLKAEMIQVSFRLALLKMLVAHRNIAMGYNRKNPFVNAYWIIVWPWAAPIVRIAVGVAPGIRSLGMRKTVVASSSHSIRSGLAVGQL